MHDATADLPGTCLCPFPETMEATGCRTEPLRGPNRVKNATTLPARSGSQDVDRTPRGVHFDRSDSGYAPHAIGAGESE
jgi:hypothetical protein